MPAHAELENAMPLVSVILPTRDRPHLLSRAVQSVLAQDERNFELLIIDNNTSRRVADEHRATPWLGDPKVRVIVAPDVRSAAAARNRGLVAARGEFVSYLDDDDAYRPEKLRKQLARAQYMGSPIALCGAAYHLTRRVRCVQCERDAWRDDELLLKARWGTPFILHRATAEVRFDETLPATEDLVFGLQLLAAFGATHVPVVPEPLVDVFPQTGNRVNISTASRRRAAARVLTAHPQRFSRGARRRFVLQTLLAIAKLSRRPAQCLGLGWRLLRESRGADWRACANACVVSLGLFRDRWVS
jgi:hypothetical protein